MEEDLDPRRKRLLFRSRHMGMRETDILLGAFARESLASLDDGLLDEYEALLDEADADLLKWILQRERAPERIPARILNLVIQFNKRN